VKILIRFLEILYKTNLRKMAKTSILNTIERKVILLLGDIFLITIGINLFVTSALDIQFNNLYSKITMMFLGILLFLLISYILDFYNLEKASQFNLVISQSLFVSGVFVLLFFLIIVLVLDTGFWRIPLMVFLFGTPIQIFLWRLLYKNTFKFIPTIKKVLFIYDSSTSEVVKKNIKHINGNDLVETYYQVKLTFNVKKNKIKEKEIFKDSLNKIDSCILSVNDFDDIPNEVEKTILNLIQSGKEVQSYSSFYENIYEALPIQSHNNSFYEILQLKNTKVRYIHLLFTAIIDYTLSIMVGFFLILLIPFVFITNLFMNGGPLFYIQKRIGRYGKEFNIYKFRSMVVDAEKGGAQMSKEGDIRITSFGKILRKTRIDELPQILSVIKGDMSFIGPRPERKIFTDQLNNISPFYNTRHIVKPGITGWAQVKYKYGVDLEDSIKKLEYDLFYIKNKSISLDIRIIFKTITTVLFSRGI
tara:strand:+ start:11688 stop:13112 length:1425 start_codon:yes stop_codon:yes gene_type:complete